MHAVKGSPGHSPKEGHREDLPGCQSDVMTTMMYIHVFNRRARLRSQSVGWTLNPLAEVLLC